MDLLSNLGFILPRRRQRAGGTAATPGYNATDIAREVPNYDNHRNDIFDNRQADDSRTLLDNLVRHDPDVSASIFAFGTISSSATMVISAFDQDGQPDIEGIRLGKAITNRLFSANDYSLGFSSKNSQKQFLDDLRYSSILRGAYGFELVYDRQLQPSSLRIVDMATVEWEEDRIGVYRPLQEIEGADAPVSLNIPTFFTEKFHQNPNDIYGYSLFVSSINTIAARQQVMNDLYRIMQITGYPRLDITVLESVLMANAPPGLRNDPVKRQQFVDTQLGAIRGAFANIRPDQAFVHTDTVKAGVINDRSPGSSLQITEVIETLDAQNQAALKTMPSVVGRGGDGTTASTESRLFALSCDSLNASIASGLSSALTLAARIAGYQGHIEVKFTPIELRPTLELEPQLTMRASRLKQDLSLGVITDLEYHMELYNRPPPEGFQQLSGTRFLEQSTIEVAADRISPNDDPNGRGLTSEGSESAASNSTASGEVNDG